MKIWNWFISNVVQYRSKKVMKMASVMFTSWMEGSFPIDLLYFYLILMKLLDILKFTDKLNVHTRKPFITSCLWPEQKNKCLWFDWSVIKFIFVHTGCKPNSVKWMYWLAWSTTGSLVTMWTRPMRPNICVMSRLWQETSPRFTHIDLSCLLSQSSSSGKSADSKNPTTWWFPLVRFCLRGRGGWVLGLFVTILCNFKKFKWH